MAKKSVMRQDVKQQVVSRQDVQQQDINPHIEEWAHLKPNQYCTLEVTPVGSHMWTDTTGRFHRVDESGIQDGPSFITINGFQEWCIHDVRHRLDGPALILPGGAQYWCLDDGDVTPEEWASDPRVIKFHSQTPEEAEQWLKRL